LLKNLLVSREPLYGVGEWAARHAPELLGLTPTQLPPLNDDRVGRCLDRLFDADIPSLTLAVVAHAVRELAVDLDELHTDATTITTAAGSSPSCHAPAARTPPSVSPSATATPAGNRSMTSSTTRAS